MKVTKVEAPSCEGGENPIWHTGEQALYYIDNTGCKVHRHHPESGVNTTWSTPGVITTLAFHQSGNAVVTLHSGIASLDFTDGAATMLHPLPENPPYVYNDGTVDIEGRFIIGGCTTNFADPQPDGGLFILDRENTLRQLDTGIHFSNGNCFSPDGRTLYFADSYTHTIYAYDYDPSTGQSSNRRIFAETHNLGGLPDGAKTDSLGRLWVAIYGGGIVACYADDGALLQTIEIPVKLVSSVSFGGSSLDRLYVTTIAKGALNEPSEAGAGDLYVIDGLGATGHAENLCTVHIETSHA